MRSILLSFPLLVGLGSLVAGQEAPKAVECSTGGVEHVVMIGEQECIEAAVKLGAKVRRRGVELILGVDGKSPPVVIRSNPRGCARQEYEKCMDRRLSAYRPDERLYLVFSRYTEGHSVEVVSQRDGKTAGLYDFPVFSPNGKGFVAIEQSDMEDHGRDISVWRWNAKGPVMEWSIKVEEGKGGRVYFSDPTWDGEDRIVLKAQYPSTPAPVEIDIVKVDGSWLINHSAEHIR